MNKSTYIGLEDIYRSSSCIFFIISSRNSSFDICADGAPSIRVRNLSEALSILPTKSRLSLAACMERSTANRSIGEVEFFFGDAETRRRWFLAKFVPTEPGDLQCVFMDITSLKEREERNQLILSEFGHRIKNNMTMVQSIARLTLKTTRSDEKALAIFSGSSNDPAVLSRQIEKDRRRCPALPPARLRQEPHILDTMGKSGRHFELSAHADCRKGPHALYFRGDAYAMQLIASEWTLIGGLAKRTGGTGSVALYQLAPEHDWHQGLHTADRAFDEAEHGPESRILQLLIAASRGIHDLASSYRADRGSADD